jgi:hypothetical protein
MLTKSIQKVAEQYCCNTCHYISSKQSNYKKHLLTAKHKTLTSVNKLEQKIPEKIPNGVVCEKCNKFYHSRVGLWKHYKKCSSGIEKNISKIDLTNPTIVLELIKQNQEFKSLLIQQQRENNENQTKLIDKVIELSKEPRIVNHGTMTQNNNKFNLQFFLNDTCKDAITIKQFIDNIQISLEDLESVGRNGFVKGISDIVLEQLKILDVTKRPIHCTDLKREVIYLKEDEHKWNKDDDDNTRLKNVIKTVENKSWNKVPVWYQNHPDAMISDTPENVMHAQIVRNVCGNENPEKQRDKIIKVIAKETHLDEVKEVTTE